MDSIRFGIQVLQRYPAQEEAEQNIHLAHRLPPASHRKTEVRYVPEADIQMRAIPNPEALEATDCGRPPSFPALLIAA